MSDAPAGTERTPALLPVRSGGPVLIYALSGLGKSALARRHPDEVLDADDFLYAAVATAFPHLDPRARLRAWRELCSQRPWTSGGDALAQWATVRRAFTEPFIAAMMDGPHRLVVTSLLDPPWMVSAYYGIDRGRYLSHLRAAGREPDNSQSEAMNHRLEGYSPLVRLAPGTFLGDRSELRQLLIAPCGEAAMAPAPRMGPARPQEDPGPLQAPGRQHAAEVSAGEVRLPLVRDKRAGPS